MNAFYANYPASGGGGVTSLNGLTGALTLVAGSGITITPSGSNITIAATGGSGANTFLSNLTSPTAINQNLLPNASGTINIGSSTLLFNNLFTTALLDTANTTSVQPQNRILVDSLNANSVVWNSRFLVDHSGTITSVDWENRLLLDNAGTNSVVWQSRVLVDSAANFALIWDTTGVTINTALHLNGATSGAITLKAAATTTPYTVIMPAAQGTGALTNDGAGNLSWTPSGGSGANTALSNLAGTTSINSTLLPASSGGINIGSTTLPIGYLFANGIKDSSGNVEIDLNFRNLNDTIGVTQLHWSSSGVNLSTALSLDGSTSGAITLKAAATTTPYTVTLPSAQGTAGQVLTDSDGAGTLTWTTPAGAGPVIPFDFGSGADGSAVLDGTNTFPWADLVGSTYYMQQYVNLVNLTINSGITLVTQSYSITVSGTLANAGIIDNSGGGGGTGGVGGQGNGGSGGIKGGFFAVGTQILATNLGQGAPGNPGETGSTTAGTDSQNANPSGLAPLNALGGSSGNGGAGQAGAGGAGTSDVVYNGDQAYVFTTLTNHLATVINSSVTALQGGDSGVDGASGGGDGTNNGGGGGGAGASGGVIGIWARNFNNTGTIRSNGGAGGAGESPTTSTLGVGGGGGGGGGAGGFVYIVRQNNIATGTIQANGGGGGAGGTGHGTAGTNGTAGTSGSPGAVVLYTTSTGTWT